MNPYPPGEGSWVHVGDVPKLMEAHATSAVRAERDEWKTEHETLQKEITRLKSHQQHPGTGYMLLMKLTCDKYAEYEAARAKYQKVVDEKKTECFHCKKIWPDKTPREEITAHTAECPEHPAVKRASAAVQLLRETKGLSAMPFDWFERRNKLIDPPQPEEDFIPDQEWT
jgi:hypothetical protein